jgi:hypothetical protein
MSYIIGIIIGTAILYSCKTIYGMFSDNDEHEEYIAITSKGKEYLEKLNNNDK